MYLMSFIIKTIQTTSVMSFIIKITHIGMLTFLFLCGDWSRRFAGLSGPAFVDGHHAEFVRLALRQIGDVEFGVRRGVGIHLEPVRRSSFAFLDYVACTRRKTGRFQI